MPSWPTCKCANKAQTWIVSGIVFRRVMWERCSWAALTVQFNCQGQQAHGSVTAELGRGFRAHVTGALDGGTAIMPQLNTSKLNANARTLQHARTDPCGSTKACPTAEATKEVLSCLATKQLMCSTTRYPADLCAEPPPSCSQIVFVSVYASSAERPRSRPMPDSPPMPPQGRRASVGP